MEEQKGFAGRVIARLLRPSEDWAAKALYYLLYDSRMADR